MNTPPARIAAAGPPGVRTRRRGSERHRPFAAFFPIRPLCLSVPLRVLCESPLCALCTLRSLDDWRSFRFARSPGSPAPGSPAVASTGPPTAPRASHPLYIGSDTRSRSYRRHATPAPAPVRPGTYPPALPCTAPNRRHSRHIFHCKKAYARRGVGRMNPSTHIQACTPEKQGLPPLCQRENSPKVAHVARFRLDCDQGGMLESPLAHAAPAA